MTEKFQKLYNQLNPEQKEAVDFIEGPVMVVAGPGTGKTQVLTLRLANILLKTQVNPGNILALTFTENGAAEMRRRLAVIIGRTAYQVHIATFHSFCNDLIKTYPEEFSEILGRKSANEIEQIYILKKCFDDLFLKYLKPFGEPYFYLKETRRSISQLKREGFGPAEFLTRAQKEEKKFSKIDDLYYDSGRYQGKMKGKYADWKKQIEKNLELAKIYERYQAELVAAKFYDYDDMILEVTRTLQTNSDFLLRLQERFQYFLVDEHQDTNNAQNKVLELLSNFHANPNLFVVGDEKQAIFRFQGATLENFFYFKKLYPEARLVTLRRNYRSTQSILDLARSFIGYNQKKISDVLGGIADGLEAVAGHPERLVEIYEFKNPETENYFVAKKIAALIEERTPAEEIAIIYRDNRDGWAVGEMLDKHGLPYRLESAENILSDPEIKKLVAVLKFLNDFNSEEKLFTLLTFDWWDIPALDIYKLNAPGLRRALTLLELLGDEKRLKKIRVGAVPEIRQLAGRLQSWKKLAANANVLVLFETVVRESGLLKQLLAEKNSALGLARLESFYRELKKLMANHPETILADFVRYLDSLEKHAVGIKNGAAEYRPAMVRLMTAHGAKGLEFDHVFIVGAHDGHWGNRHIPQLIKLPYLSKYYDMMIYHSADGEEKNDEERRLFYVAVTRARKMVYISYASFGLNEQAQLASQFLEEMKPELKAKGAAERYEKNWAIDKAMLFAPSRSQGWSVFEKDFLRQLFFKRGLSATALNNFLACPWRYFYLNLLKIPRAKSRAQMYGTAVHAALKDFFNGLKRRGVDLSFLLTSFEQHLQKEPLTKTDYQFAFQRGREVLTNYYNFYRASFGAQTLNEFRIKEVILENPILGPEGLRLTGSLDKIEYLPGGREVNVVDYKTGQPKSRNELEGKTKNANGDYKRQLVFYKLLLDEHLAFPAKMVSGEIDFVEADKSGRFHKERFEIVPTETKELKEKIFEVADQVLNFKFADQKCAEVDCEFCQLGNDIGRAAPQLVIQET